jgi:hypothetical protein
VLKKKSFISKVADFPGFQTAHDRDMQGVRDNEVRRTYARFMDVRGYDAPPQNMDNYVGPDWMDPRVLAMQYEGRFFQRVRSQEE